MKRLITGSALLVLAAALVAILAPAAASGAKTKCGSSPAPPPGSTVNGGLEVDGICMLDDVTVNGGIVIDPSGRLEISDGSVSGGINAGANAELDINHDLGGGTPLPGATKVSGGIKLTSPLDYDIISADVSGGIKVTGDSPFAAPELCGNNISGGVSVSNSSSFGVFIGDPEDPPLFGGVPCPGNTISGGVKFVNLTAIGTGSNAVEGNTISGEVTLDNAKSEVNGNTLKGKVKCSNGGAVTPGEPPDGPDNPCS